MTPDPAVADLSEVDTSGTDGVAWSLPHGGDLDANLVALRPGASIAEHVNDAVDVFIYVRSGGGELRLDGRPHPLCPDLVILVPQGARRALQAGPDGMTYLSIHQRRPPLTISGGRVRPSGARAPGGVRE